MPCGVANPHRRPGSGARSGSSGELPARRASCDVRSNVRTSPSLLGRVSTSSDDLPVVGHGLYPSVSKNGVLVNGEAPDHRVVRRSLAHAHSLPRRAHERTSQDAEQTRGDFKSDRGRNFGPAPAVSATDQADQDDQEEHGSNDDRKPIDAVRLCFTDACAVRVGGAGGRRDHCARHHCLFATDIVVREIRRA